MPSRAADRPAGFSPYRAQAPCAAAQRNLPDRESARQRRCRKPSRTYARCRPGQTEGSAISCGTPHHQPGAAAVCDFLIALIETTMFERDYSLSRAGLALAHSQNFRLRPQGITCKDRARKSGFLHTEVADGGSQGGVLHGKTDNQTKGENRIHQRFAEFSRFGIFVIDVDSRRIIRQRRKQNVVHVGDRAPNLMDKRLPYRKLLKIESRHFWSSPRNPRNETTALNSGARFRVAFLLVLPAF